MLCVVFYFIFIQRFEISINTVISILRFYRYIKNINEYFEKNIDNMKIIKNSLKYF